LAAFFSSRRTSPSMIDSRRTTVLIRLSPRKTIGNTGQKNPPLLTATQITVQMMLGTRKAANDSSTSRRHLLAPRALSSARGSDARSAPGLSGGTRSETSEDSSPRVRLPYKVSSRPSYSSRVSRPSA
jgi:hypothetical protein